MTQIYKILILLNFLRFAFVAHWQLPYIIKYNFDGHYNYIKCMAYRQLCEDWNMNRIIKEILNIE